MFINAQLWEDGFFYPIDPTLPIDFIEEENEDVIEDFIFLTQENDN